MTFKKRILVTLGVLVAVAFISGASILAASTFGTTNDPLVTLSYLTQKLKPQIMAEVNADISAAEASLRPALDADINSFKADIDAKLSSESESEDSAGFTVVSLSKNQTVSCSIGTEILLRVGTATGTGSAPALVDSTSGSTLSSGGALIANHMYMVSIQGNGFKATASAKVLIRGTYTIS